MTKVHDPIAALRSELPALRDRVYLNTGTSGPLPRSAAEDQIALLNLFVNEGFASPPALEAYGQALRRAKSALAAVVGASARNIALTHSTSDGVSIVAAGLPWAPGDEVIISDLEHTSGIAPWLHLARTKGVRIVSLASERGYVAAEAVAKAVSERTRLICMSHVSYATGAILPVAEVARAIAGSGALLLVDGAQGAGHLPVDVDDLGCHFYAFPGQKWLLGPEGTGALYVRDDVLEMLDPTRIGWASVAEESLAALAYRLHPDARRFETGTVHAPAFAGLARAIQLLEAIGWQAIFEHATRLAAQARAKLAEVKGVSVLTPAWAASGLLTFAVSGVDPERMAKALWAKHRIVIRSIPAPRALRAAFHIFNTEEDVDRLVRAVALEAAQNSP